MKKVVFGVLVFLYVVVSVFVTTCLLTYNDYRVSVFNDSSLIIVNDDNKVADYKQGSLLIVSKDISKIENNQEILYYNTYDNEVDIEIAKVTGMEQISDNETTFLLENGNSLSSEYVIGATNNIKSYPLLGSILGILESRWGYLLIIILPILIIFVYEILELIKELKPKTDKKKTGKKNEETKTTKK